MILLNLVCIFAHVSGDGHDRNAGLTPRLNQVLAFAKLLLSQGCVAHPGLEAVLPIECDAEAILSFLCMITPLCSYLYGGLYGGCKRERIK
jgi:hypothetical protein